MTDCGISVDSKILCPEIHTTIVGCTIWGSIPAGLIRVYDCPACGGSAIRIKNAVIGSAELRRDWHVRGNKGHLATTRCRLRHLWRKFESAMVLD